jgi:16S rRNA processing protein RimM
VEECEIVSETQAIVKFEFVNKLEEAREISGCRVYFEGPISVSSMNQSGDFSQLIGFTAFDKQLGELGPVSDFMPGEMNPCFLIDHHGRELIVPAVSELIVQINNKKKTIHFNLPEGLTEL